MLALSDEERFARAVVYYGKRRGILLHPQHLRILTILVRRMRLGQGPIDADTLALAADAKTEHPERLVPTRITPLRRALAPYGLEIQNARYAGYRLCAAV